MAEIAQAIRSVSPAGNRCHFVLLDKNKSSGNGISWYSAPADDGSLSLLKLSDVTDVYTYQDKDHCDDSGVQNVQILQHSS